MKSLAEYVFRKITNHDKRQIIMVEFEEFIQKRHYTQKKKEIINIIKGIAAKKDVSMLKVLIYYL